MFVASRKKISLDDSCLDCPLAVAMNKLIRWFRWRIRIVDVDDEKRLFAEYENRISELLTAVDSLRYQSKELQSLAHELANNVRLLSPTRDARGRFLPKTMG